LGKDNYNIHDNENKNNVYNERTACGNSNFKFNNCYKNNLFGKNYNYPNKRIIYNKRENKQNNKNINYYFILFYFILFNLYFIFIFILFYFILFNLYLYGCILYLFIYLFFLQIIEKLIFQN